WRELYGAEAEPTPAYAGDWAEATGLETLLSAAERHLVVRRCEVVAAGDVLVFRYRANMVAKHVGIATGEATFVHAVESRRVCEVPLSDWWRRRTAGVFRFPGVTG
ncbi:MAG: NlpC/P60 family protein, partial [Pseudomonadota bacterium]